MGAREEVPGLPGRNSKLLPVGILQEQITGSFTAEKAAPMASGSWNPRNDFYYEDGR